MAKLSAYGQTEVLRLEKAMDVTDSDLVSWRRTTYALMDNGRVLKKIDVLFKENGTMHGRRHSYGWKRVHLKPGVDAAKLESHGYVRVR